MGEPPAPEAEALNCQNDVDWEVSPLGNIQRLCGLGHTQHTLTQIHNNNNNTHTHTPPHTRARTQRHVYRSRSHMERTHRGPEAN